MLFNSYEFIVFFLPITLFGFLYLHRNHSTRLAFAWLVLCSLFFYGWWNPRYLFLIIGSITFNYLTGTLILRSRAAGRAQISFWIMCLGIAFNLGLLGWFKYANFFLDTVNGLSGSGFQLVDVVLPIGISFFTFQQITYLVDAWKGISEEHSALQYSLFVVFFPQLIAGPIVHHSEMLPQFSDHQKIHNYGENIAIGLTIFSIGLFKKVVIADTLALSATPVFSAADSGETLHFFAAWRGTFAYSFQLYFDFSGYSDMAIGLARMFGIKLPLNFHAPYKATGIIDFWRRWHMTLSRFLRDYIYIPLGGSRHGRLRQGTNIMATMLIGGLWHGAGWTFVVWGGIHGLLILLNHLWRLISPFGEGGALRRFFSRTLTFLLVSLAWVFFRAETFDGALRIFDGMRNLPHTLAERLGPLADGLRAIGFRFDGPWIDGSDLMSVAWLLVLLTIVWWLPNTQQWLRRHEPALDLVRAGISDGETGKAEKALRWPAWAPTTTWALLAGGIFLAAFLNLSQVSEFLYFQF